MAITALALSATPALAAQRYAAPTPAGAKNCSSLANACALATAVDGAAKGDEVIVEPGSYGTAATPLSSSVASGIENVNVHGVDTSPGAPSAKIYTDETYGIELYGAGDTIGDLEIMDNSNANGGSLLLEGASGERLIVRSGPKERDACVLELTTVLRDSVCDSEGDVAALAVSGTLDGPNEVTLRNVTAIDPTGDGIEAASDSFTERSVKLSVLNTIARGGLDDILGIRAINPPAEPVSITTSHSNYRTADTKLENGATLTDDATSKTTGNQGLTELFASPTTGDFQEALGAQTIGAGLIEPANGAFDFEGNPRVFAAGGSCASTDIGAGQFVPSAGPAVTGVTASAVLQMNATLSGAANPLGGPGTAHFDYAPAAPGGGPPTSYSSTATQCLPIADAAQSVSATLSGLALGTTYYYRLVATNANATTTPAFTSTFTTEGTICGCVDIVHFPLPELIGVKQSARRWRERNASKEKGGKGKSHKQKLPLGTTFSFTLNQAATVTFDFTEQLSGLEVGRRCVAQTKRNIQTKHNKHERRCLRTVTAGALTFVAHAGSNKWNFQGVISKHKRLPPGSYTLLITASALGRQSKPSTLHFTITRD